MPPLSSLCVTWISVFIFQLQVSLSVTTIEFNKFGDSDYGLQTPQIIESRGFSYELHRVVTPDGYILGVHRIIHPFVNHTRASILIMHGIGCSSVNFLVTGPGGYIEEPISVVGPNIGFELAKRGYDVWLLDQRGTPFSSGHIVYDSKRDKSYYDFALDHFALLDLPAVIEYMRKTTLRHQIGYIGHSQGTTIMFMLLSRIKKYNDIIYPFIALAPVFRLDYAYPNLFPVNIIQLKGLTAKVLMEKGGKIVNDKVGEIIEAVCIPKSVRNTLCVLALSLLNALIGFGPLNKLRSPIGYTGAYFTISAHQGAQYLQIARERRVQMADYGVDKNMKMYGQPRPPLYNAARITNKNIAIFASESDLYGDVKDIAILKGLLKVKPLYEQTVNDPEFAHIAFICGRSDLVAKYVNAPILKLLDALYPWDDQIEVLSNYFSHKHRGKMQPISGVEEEKIEISYPTSEPVLPSSIPDVLLDSLLASEEMSSNQIDDEDEKQSKHPEMSVQAEEAIQQNVIDDDLIEKLKERD